MTISIPRDNVADFAHICAELCRQGIKFRAGIDGNGWFIELRGF